MKKIKLSRGKFAIVDDEDFEWLNKWKWHTQKVRKRYYAIRQFPFPTWETPKWILMHRLIMNCPDNLQIDHKNLDGLDNRKNNLRICTNAQNNQSRGKMKEGSSQFRGVCRWGNKWRVQITKDYRHLNLGDFETEYEAAMVYDFWAKKLFGEFARLNF